MRAQLIKVLDDLRASYWFVPLCFLLAAISLALFTRWLDSRSALSVLGESSFVFSSGASDARTILSVIASVVMGVAGVTFSITIVAVSFASSNFGPRLIGNFMRDRGNQFTLGAFVGTFAYCLIILATVHGSSENDSGEVIESFVPYLSVITSVVLALLCIAVLIYYIHHIAETINIENIIADIGHRLQLRIVEIYPDSEADDNLVDADDFLSATKGLNVSRISCKSIGYVQAIDHEELVKLTTSNNLLTRVHYRPGDFVTPYDCLLSVWSDEPKKVPEDELRLCFATGPQRTEHQNVLFLVEQLVEVIARALSPGVNDPFTAISCLNWYRLAILEYVRANSKKNDEQVIDRRVVQIASVTFERLISVMFDSTRQYIVSDMNVLLHCMGMLAECAWQAESGWHQQIMIAQLTNFRDAGMQDHDCPIVAASIAQRYEQCMSILNSAEEYAGQHQEKPWFGGSA